MNKSFKTCYKFIEIYSDGCLLINQSKLNIVTLNKKIIKYKKDYKILQKISKNISSIKKTNNYRNKIF